MAKQNQEAVGPWVKRRKLGSGGNGEVWSCRNIADGSILAVKFLKRINIDSLSYKRFCDEIMLLRKLSARKGILPVSASNLPPHDKDPPDIPWLAMPEAQSMENGFPEGTSLEDTVLALSNVASTLPQLAGEGVHHRDIKPQNLFIYNKEIVIGDFGLATFPGKDALTLEGQKIGPLHYIAPEMLQYQKGVDESLADVYSLAKTLWVLVAGQKFPPPGEQRVSEPTVRLSSYVLHQKTYLLDKLIESATRINPSERVALADFAKELRDWTQIKPHNVGGMDGHIFKLNDRLQTALLPFLTEDTKAKEYTRRFEECKKMLIAPLKELQYKLPSLENISVSLGENIALTGTLGVNPCISCPLEGPAIVICGPGKTHRPLMFSSIGLCDCGKERTSLIAHHVVKLEQITDPLVVWSDARDVILGGSTMLCAINELITGLAENFSKAFQEYTELIEKYRSEIR